MISSGTKKAVAVVSDFKFLSNNFDNLYHQLRTIGKYQGEVLIITSKFTPTFFIRSIRKKNNVKVLRFKKINFDKKTDFELNNLQTFSDPNRHKTKKFQWHKLHLFDEYLKNWDYIFYLDINMNIHYDLNKILDISPTNCFMARADTYPNYDRELKSQFDQTHSLFGMLEENYKLDVQNYFQTGVMYFDTNIIEKNTKNEIINLVKKYPITKSNEQAILNLYLYLEKKIYKELPSEIDEFITYYYWQIENKKIIITKQLTEQYK
tara:strand:+ start:414 stop:1205 length:792 start_codon:yes stop_codon:yes gene_type:complete